MTSFINRSDMHRSTHMATSKLASTANFFPTSSSTSTPPPSCGVHVVQYQKNQGPVALNGAGAGQNSDYRLSITVKNHTRQAVGQVILQDAPTGVGIDVASALRYKLIVAAGALDLDPVFFKYAAQSWNSSDGLCGVGAYWDGNRNMDCGFSCY